MNGDQIGGIFRAILPGVLGYAAGRGWIPGDQVAPLSAAIITIGAAAWSTYTNAKTVKIASVAAMPEVQKVVAVPEIANGTLAADPKVVAPNQ